MVFFENLLLTCFDKDYTLVPATKTKVIFTLDNGSKVTKWVTSIDSTPSHNRNGIRLNIANEEMMDLCLDEIHDILKRGQVGMLVDLVRKVIQKMDIVPTFTCTEIAQRMENGQRFKIVHKQVCSLQGTHSLALMARKPPLP